MKFDPRKARQTAPTNEGFTLVELLVVVALIGLLSVFALPSVNNYFKLSLNATSREMASIIKEAYNSTAMTGRVHRLVYDLKENSYWVESGPSDVLLDTTATREKEERRKRFAMNLSEEKPKALFTLDKTVTRKKISLPQGVEFEDILTQQSKDPVTEGLAYTHFFPHGLAEQTIIHLKDNSNHHVSLIVAPLIGQTTLVERYTKEDESYAP